VSFYRKLQERKQKVWMSPAQGLLAGTITKVVSEQKVEIKDLQGNNWVIDIADTIWRGRLRPAEGLKIKILGHMKEQDRFIANEIRPWKGRRDQGGKRHLRYKGKHQRQQVTPK
jgi:ATP-dependent 26S proteasome regulatory subunit